MSHHQAGFRTHTPVGIGASLLAVVASTQSDTRIAVVTGIGLLGVGAILEEGCR